VLSRLVRRHPACDAERVVVASLPAAGSTAAAEDESQILMGAVARLWVAGASIDWIGIHADEQRRRIPLPTYPFEHQRYWIDVPPLAIATKGNNEGRRTDLADWFYTPVWNEVPLSGHSSSSIAGSLAQWLVFVDEAGLADRLVARLEAPVDRITTVEKRDAFAR